MSGAGTATTVHLVARRGSAAMKGKHGPVLYCGDPHGRFDHIILAARRQHASAVVLLGDIEAPQPLHEALAAIQDRVWFIHGNHDTDSEANFCHLWDSRLAGRNVDGRVVELPDGTRLAGLGGVFRETVWHPGAETGQWGQRGQPASPRRPCPQSSVEKARLTSRQERWRRGPALRHWSSIYPQTYERLRQARADVLVTHEAPGYHPLGFAVLDDLARDMGVKVTVHGHQHDCLDSSQRWAAQGFRSYGVGLRGITAIDGEGNATVIVAGEIDARRAHRQAGVTAVGESGSNA